MKLKMNVPENVQRLTRVFETAGHQLYIVGGAVRDALLKLDPKDYDLATDAEPDKVIEMLRRERSAKIDLTGKAFGVVRLNYRGGEEYEIATFRKDVGEGRRPDAVEFTTIEDDVNRRDLTINALFYDLSKGEIVDFVGGIDDVLNGVIKSVGKPEDRFREDKLRVLRVIRFAGRMGAEIDEETASAIKSDPELSEVSPERIRDEFIRSIQSTVSPHKTIKMFGELGLFSQIFPGLNIKLGRHRTNDHIAEIAALLRDNSPFETERILKSLKYTSKEAHMIKLLLWMNVLEIEDAVIFKRSWKKTAVSDITYGNFAHSASVPTKKAVGIFKFVTAPPSVTGKELASRGIKGSDIGKAMKAAEEEEFLSLIKELFERYI
jgi:tRNA nucleotidyltransferase/poly(A) polymerase